MYHHNYLCYRSGLIKIKLTLNKKRKKRDHSCANIIKGCYIISTICIYQYNCYCFEFLLLYFINVGMIKHPIHNLFLISVIRLSVILENVYNNLNYHESHCADSEIH